MPPEDLVAAATQSASTASAVLFALLLHPDGPARYRQLQRLQIHSQNSVETLVLGFEPQVMLLDDDAKLSLVSQIQPTLHRLSVHERHLLIGNLRYLVAADNKVSLFEFVLVTITEQRSNPTKQVRSLGNRHLDEILDEVKVLLWAVARHGADSPPGFLHAYRTGLRYLGIWSMQPPGEVISYPRIEWALRGIRSSSPKARSSVIEACRRTILADSQVLPNERKLLQAIILATELPQGQTLEDQR